MNSNKQHNETKIILRVNNDKDKPRYGWKARIKVFHKNGRYYADGFKVTEKKNDN